jgi:hypothetical protein
MKALYNKIYGDFIPKLKISRAFCFTTRINSVAEVMCKTEHTIKGRKQIDTEK